MTKVLFRALLVIALSFALFVGPGFLFGLNSRSDAVTIMNRQVQSLAATTYFTQDLYAIPPTLQKELHGVFAVDFNNDGFMDLIALQHDFQTAPDPFLPARILAFTNNQNGTFIESTSQVLGDVRATCPNSYVVADFNGDGWEDIFIVDMGNDREPWGQGKKFMLFIQKANGTLVDEASARLPTMFDGIPHCAAEGDIDGDGSIDLIVTSTGGPNYQLLVNDGQGYFQYETDRLPVAKSNWIPNNCLMLDFNRDGYMDIFMGEEGGRQPQDFIFLNDGTGHFTFAPDATIPTRLLGAGSGTNGAHSADLNGDGWMDLVLSCVKNTEQRIQVLFNNGNGTFSDVSNRVSGPYLNIRAAGFPCSAIADCNGDGWPDLLAARNVWGGSFVPHLFINHAGSQFEDITSTAWSFHEVNGGEPPLIEFVEIDNDEDMDAIGIYPGSDQIYVLVNQTPYPISEAALPYPIAPSLVSPADGTTIYTNSPTLAWNAVDSAFEYDVQVSTSSDFSTTVASKSHCTTNSLALKNLSNATTYYWRVRAYNTRGVGPWSQTYSFFLVTSQTITLSSPEGGEAWIISTTQPITWFSSGVSGNLNINLYKGTSNLGAIATGIPVGNGVYSWRSGYLKNGTKVALGSTYRVSIVSAVNKTITAISNAYFSLVKPKISVKSPVSGAVWKANSVQRITWTYSAVSGTVNIFLYRYGVLKGQVAASIPVSDLGFSWTVGGLSNGKAVPVGVGYSVRVTTSDGKISCKSPGTFTIKR